MLLTTNKTPFASGQFWKYNSYPFPTWTLAVPTTSYSPQTKVWSLQTHLEPEGERRMSDYIKKRTRLHQNRQLVFFVKYSYCVLNASKPSTNFWEEWAYLIKEAQSGKTQQSHHVLQEASVSAGVPDCSVVVWSPKLTPLDWSFSCSSSSPLFLSYSISLACISTLLTHS